MFKLNKISSTIKCNNIFENAIDQDFSSLYPNIIITCNIDSETLFGKVITDNMRFERLGELISEGNHIRIGHELLGLPNFEEILVNIDKFQ